MPRSPQRFVALAGMIAIAPLSGLLLIWAWLLVAGAFENQEPSGLDRTFAAAAGAGFASTLIALAGLTAGSRRLTAVASLAQVLTACWLLALWAATDFRLGADDTDLVAVLLAVILVDVVALSAAALPEKPSARRTSWALEGTMTRSAQRSAAVAGMSLVALVSPWLLLLELEVLEADEADDFFLVTTGAVGVHGAVVALAGLVFRIRSLAAAAAIVQAVAAGFLLVLRAGAQPWLGVWDVAATVVLVCIVVADALTMWAAFLPRS